VSREPAACCLLGRWFLRAVRVAPVACVVAAMTRIKYGDAVYLKITKEEWEFSGGETNPELLKLRHKKRDRRTYRYFKLRY